ncbi:MAG: hypothetical protein V1761_05305 [bacterium]
MPPYSRIRLHLVPFEPLHAEIIRRIPESYIITIMRRMMYRIAAGVAANSACLAIVNGESIGQVASQTLESMACIGRVTDRLVLRPLATTDKIDIMAIARRIGTFDVSIRPFEDCCTIYLPKNPVIRPAADVAENLEATFAFAPMVETAIANIKTLVLLPAAHFDITAKGLVVQECL